MIDPRTLSPLDTATILSSVEKTGRLVIADQAHAARRRLGGDRGRGRRARVSVAQGADRAGDGARRDRPLQRADGGVRAAQRGEDRRGRPSGPRRRRPSPHSVVGAPHRDARTPTRARDLLRTMWRIRLFEERVAQLKRTLQVHGLIHLSIGGEGVAAAVCRQLRDDDAVYSGHRAHGHAIAKGAPMDRVMAELMGRATGLCHGLGGSMHLVDARARVHGGDRRRRRQPAARARHRPRAQAAPAATGDGRVLRRRRGPGRPFQRVGQPRGAVGAAGDLRVREQRHGRVHLARGALDGRAGQRRRRAVRVRARRPSTAATCRRCTARSPDSSAARAGPGPPARVPDVPPARPLRGRRREVPRPAGRREWARRDPIARLRRRDRRRLARRADRDRDRARGARRGRGGGALRARQPVPGPGAARSSTLVYAT